MLQENSVVAEIGSKVVLPLGRGEVFSHSFVTTTLTFQFEHHCIACFVIYCGMSVELKAA